ncbi:MAG: hypothetical protein PVSMB11_09650 [Desulfuromonadaceae bacterium]
MGQALLHGFGIFDLIAEDIGLGVVNVGIVSQKLIDQVVVDRLLDLICTA